MDTTHPDYVPRGRLLDWLRSLGIADARPVDMVIKGRRFVAVRYSHNDGTGREFIYALGVRPACHKRSGRTVFRVPDDERDWYIAAHRDTYQGHLAVDQRYPMFMLAPWTSRERIDAYEWRLPDRKRVPITVEGAA